MRISNRIKGILYFLLVIIWLWLVVTTAIQSWRCPRMIRIEIIKTIPNSFILDFKDCDEFYRE